VLEQRIGRAHRLGQHRPVQVMNFVAEASIEHNLMGLLEFKQSLAAGVLDGGEKEVRLGGSRLARFMESVERATVRPAEESPTRPSVDRSTAAVALEKSTEAAVDDTTDAPILDDSDKDRSDPWEPLLAFAQTLLTEMVQSPEGKVGKQSSGLVRRDPESGAPYIHLPLPDRDKMARLLNALHDVLAR
jgi:hypothetical protein